MIRVVFMWTSLRPRIEPGDQCVGRSDLKTARSSALSSSGSSHREVGSYSCRSGLPAILAAAVLERHIEHVRPVPAASADVITGALRRQDVKCVVQSGEPGHSSYSVTGVTSL
jgi:hypothetical protein